MSLFTKIGNFFRGKAMEAEKALENPVLEMDLAIKDSETQISKFQEQIVRYMGSVKTNEKKITSLKDEVKKYQALAEKAVAANNETDARQALELKQTKEAELKTITQQVKKDNEIVSQLRNQLTKARTKIASAKSSRERLVCRSEAADIRKDLAKASTDLNSGGNPLAALDDLEKKVNHSEAEAEALEDMIASDNPGDALEDKYQVTTGEVDNALAKLKEKMGK